MESSTTRPQGQVHHDHPLKPRDHCPACTSRFGVAAVSAIEISKMLSQYKDLDYPEAGALIQVAFSINKHGDRISSALEDIAASLRVIAGSAA